MSFVTTKLYGRMGNQMFQIAACMGVAYRYGVEFLIPRYTGQKPGHNGDPLYFNHFPEYTGQKIKFNFKEAGHGFRPIRYSADMCIDGYFQSEKYFSHIREEVLMWFEKAFDLTRPERPDTVGLHVRRGDYVGNANFPVMPMSYYHEAIAYFRNLGYTKFMVFSDDIKWCKTVFPEDFEFASGTEHQDMFDMSRCAHQIIANSTFSWWAAWLNRNPDKIVLAPAANRWFAPHCQMDMKDVIPETWIQVPYNVVPV